jgi:starvation-inducible outer membrane lipoprotein
MKAALLILALLALAACAAAPRAAAQEDRPIPTSCNAVEEK